MHIHQDLDLVLDLVLHHNPKSFPRVAIIINVGGGIVEIAVIIFKIC